VVDWRRFTPTDFEYDFERDKLSEHGVTFDEAVECFFSDFEIRRNKTFHDRYQLLGRTFGGRKLKPIFQMKPQGVVRIITGWFAMSTAKKKTRRLPAEEIDALVVAQAEDDSAWESRVAVKRKPASLSIPGELAARAAFLARLHGEAGVNK
jgi:uncharacterized DUF497 family protein